MNVSKIVLCASVVKLPICTVVDEWEGAAKFHTQRPVSRVFIGNRMYDGYVGEWNTSR